jgi:hypothetical protein
MSETFILWTDIQDIVGPGKLWPKKVRKLFWTKNIKHFERLIVSAFVWVNGLNPVVFMEWAEMIGMCRDRAARNHFDALFKLFDNGRIYNLYAYNISLNRYEYLDGRPRRYIHRSLRNL